MEGLFKNHKRKIDTRPIFSTLSAMRFETDATRNS